MAGDEESEPAVERSGEYVEDCCCPYTDPEGGLPLADCPCFHPVELLLVAHPAPLTGGLAWFVIDPVDPMSVWLSGTSHCVRTGTGTVRTDEYRYRAYRFGTGTVRTGMVPVRYYQYSTGIVPVSYEYWIY